MTSEATSLEGCGLTGDTDAENPLRPLLNQPSSATAVPGLPGVVIGELAGISELEGSRVPLVIYAGQRTAKALRARSTIELSGDDVGQPVVLAFESGDPLRPIVLGVLRSGRRAATVSATVDADRDHVVVTAQQKLVLRCGSASITLTAAGKIIIDGAYVVSRASGTNRILGGSIQLN